MLIDIHSHTFNASDISVRSFISEARLTEGVLAEAWYGLPKPLQNLVLAAFLKVVDQGPPATAEREELLRLLERLESGAPDAAPLKLAKARDAALPEPDLDARARLLLFEAFSAPDDGRPVFAAKALDLDRAVPQAPDEDRVNALLVDYAFRSEPLADGPREVDDELPALLRWATPEQEALYEWIPTAPESAVRAAELEAEIQAAWTEIEDEQSRPMEERELLILSKARPGPGESWVHRLVRKAERWARATGQASKEAVLDLARFLGRLIGAAKAKVKSLLGFVELMGSSRQNIVEALSRSYSRVELFTPALVDYTAVTRDCPGSVLIDQVGFWETYMTYRARTEARPLLHPFFPFDPYWLISDDYVENDHALLKQELAGYASAKLGPLDEMLRHKRLVSDRDPNLLLVMRHAIERGGFMGIKLYPPARFAAYGNAQAQAEEKLPAFGDGKGLDLALMALYRYCAENDVPILAHASAGNEFGKGFGRLAGPKYWRHALAELKKHTSRPLRLCLGHFGHFYHAKVSMGWGEDFADLMQDYPFVYGDVGNSEVPGSATHGTQFVSELKKLIGKRKQLPARLLYGSDWMLNNLHDGYASFFDDFEATFRRDSDLQTHVDAFLGKNAVRFLFLGEDGKVNKNHARACAFYTNVAGKPVPEALQADRLEGLHPQP